LIHFYSIHSIIVSNQQPSSIKIERPPSTSESIKRPGHANANTSPSTTGKGKSSTTSGSKSNATLLVQPSTAKTIDKSKPHWILQVVSDADKAV